MIDGIAQADKTQEGGNFNVIITNSIIHTCMVSFKPTNSEEVLLVNGAIELTSHSQTARQTS